MASSRLSASGIGLLIGAEKVNVIAVGNRGSVRYRT
jgi:hypothetical protein